MLKRTKLFTCATEIIHMMGDERLVEAVAAGDGEALRELFDRHAPWVAAACGAPCRLMRSRMRCRKLSSPCGAGRRVTRAMALRGPGFGASPGDRPPSGLARTG